METSRLETPVNTGVSKENGRSWHKNLHVLKTSDCRSQQHFLGNFDFVEVLLFLRPYGSKRFAITKILKDSLPILPVPMAIMSISDTVKDNFLINLFF